MGEASRTCDHALIDHVDSTCPARPSMCEGPGDTGSANVTINGQPALRLHDVGHHAACCGPNKWTAVQASAWVLVNGRPLVRKGDTTLHCGGFGAMKGGSADVSDSSPAITVAPPDLLSYTRHRIVPLERLNEVIDARKAALHEARIDPKDTDYYDAEEALATVAGDPDNKRLMEDLGEKYGIPPALLAGVIAAEMNFDHALHDRILDGIERNLGIGLEGPGAASVHYDTLEAAVDYLAKHGLGGATDAAEFWDNFDNKVGPVTIVTKNPSDFPTSAEAAAIVTAAYMHMHGKPGSELTPEDMAVIWGAYRTGVRGSGLPVKSGGYTSLDEFQRHHANNAAPPFAIGGNASMALPQFERLCALFGHPTQSGDWRCCACTRTEQSTIWGS